MEEWVSLREFARVQGVSLQAVQKAIKSCRIKADVLKKDDRGRTVAIELHRGREQYAANTDPVEAAKNGKFHEAPAAAAAAVAAVPGLPLLEAAAGHAPTAPVAPGPSAAAPAQSDNDSFQRARAEKQTYEALTAKLDYLKAVGILVAVADIRREMTEILTQLKSAQLHIPDRLAQALAAESDPLRVSKMLREAIIGTHDECSRQCADASAGGVEESAPASA